MQRSVESLAVLGGATPGRDAGEVLVAKAVRRAVAEIEKYERVRVAQVPVPKALPGYVTPAVVHLLAAIMENATSYSTQDVEVHIGYPDTGAAVIEVIDRGIGITSERRSFLNGLLAAPEAADARERLRNGQLGLLVAGRLAQRYGITIQLRPALVGGTHAIVVLPPNLLAPSQEDQPYLARTQNPAPPGASPRERRGPAPALTQPSSAPAGLPRRVPTILAHGTQEPGRPKLPRRDTTPTALPQAASAPLASPTGDLMARLNSHTPPVDS